MLIGVVSDTHGHTGYTREAISVLESLPINLVLHCGDIGSTAIVPLFAKWPTHFVFGNVDHDGDELQAAIEAAGQTCHRRFGTLDVAGVKIAFLHSDDSRLFDETIRGGQYDLVCYGHTHDAEQHKAGKTLVLNPGALYRASPHTIATVELPSLVAKHVVVNDRV